MNEDDNTRSDRADLDLHGAYQRLRLHPDPHSGLADQVAQRMHDRRRRRRAVSGAVAASTAAAAAAVVILAPNLVDARGRTSPPPLAGATTASESESEPATPTPERHTASPEKGPQHVACLSGVAEVVALYLAEDSYKFATPEEAVAAITGPEVEIVETKDGDLAALRTDGTPYAMFAVRSLSQRFGVSSYTRCPGEGPWRN